MLLEGKKAVVTGGTRGIGFAIVETFLKNGASVALFGSRQETVDKALAKLKAENPDWDVIGRRRPDRLRRSGRGDGQGHRSVWPHRYSSQ